MHMEKVALAEEGLKQTSKRIKLKLKKKENLTTREGPGKLKFQSLEVHQKVFRNLLTKEFWQKILEKK